MSRSLISSARVVGGEDGVKEGTLRMANWMWGVVVIIRIAVGRM